MNWINFDVSENAELFAAHSIMKKNKIAEID